MTRLDDPANEVPTRSIVCNSCKMENSMISNTGRDEKRASIVVVPPPISKTYIAKSRYCGVLAETIAFPVTRNDSSSSEVV